MIGLNRIDALNVVGRNGSGAVAQPGHIEHDNTQHDVQVLAGARPETATRSAEISYMTEESGRPGDPRPYSGGRTYFRKNQTDRADLIKSQPKKITSRYPGREESQNASQRAPRALEEEISSS